MRDRAMAAASSGIVITDATLPDNPIVDTNPAFERMSGYRRAEILGTNCRFLQGRHGDQPERAIIRRAIAESREVGVTILNERKDGEPFWNELHISPVFDVDGRLTHFVGVQTDITERKAAEDRGRFLAAASDILASSLDYAVTAERVADLAVPWVADWCAIDAVGEDQTLRRMALAHRDPARLALGRAITERQQGDPDAPYGPTKAIRSGRSHMVTAVSDDELQSATDDPALLRALRDLGLVSVLSAPVSARGRIFGVITLATAESGRRFGPADLGLAEDLARRMAMAIDNADLFSEAQAAVRARDQFLSIAAHELRTPVASIKGYSQMLLRGHRKGKLQPERLARSLETIDSATDRLALLTSDLLDVSRIRLGQLPLRPRLLDLVDLAREVVDRYGDTLGDLHPLELSVPEAPCPVIADPDRLEQVLANLIDNAAKYSPDGGAVRVTVAPREDGVVVEVHDAGIGLPGEAVEGIFQPFGRAPNAVEHNLPGLGLGLYISRGIVDRHHGRIWARSDGEGHGTTVGFWIPRPGMGLSPAETETNGSPGGHDRRVVADRRVADRRVADRGAPAKP